MTVQYINCRHGHMEFIFFLAKMVIDMDLGCTDVVATDS